MPVSPRQLALAALKKHGLALAAARLLPDEELLAIKGIGKAALAAIRGEDEKEEVSRETKEASPRVSLIDPLEYHAERMLAHLAEKQALTPAVVSEAWRLARAFHQEAGAKNGAVILHDGMAVEISGQRFVLRTSLRPGEPAPASAKKALLVPE